MPWQNSADLGQNIPEGHPVNLPNRYKECRYDRADNNAWNPEHNYAAQGPEKNHEFVHLGIFADQFRPKQIIDAAHHQCTEYGQDDCFYIMTANGQDNGGRSPNER